MESTNYDRVRENYVEDDHRVMECSLNPHYHERVNAANSLRSSDGVEASKIRYFSKNTPKL